MLMIVINTFINTMFFYRLPSCVLKISQKKLLCLCALVIFFCIIEFVIENVVMC